MKVSRTRLPPATYEANNSLGFLIKRCGIVMTQIAERSFDSHEISFTQWMTLIWLAQRKQASPTQLSAHLGHDMGFLTRVIDDLDSIPPSSGVISQELYRPIFAAKLSRIAIAPGRP